MPIHRSRDDHGYFFQWGNHGAKYYFNDHNHKSMMDAYNKAIQQSRAAYSHGYKRKGN